MFDIALPAHVFIWRVLVFSCLSLLPFLVLFVALTPGFTTLLATNGEALSRFARQIVTNGVVVVFAVTYLGFVTTALRLRQGSPIRITALLGDAALRTVLFIGLHGLIYVFSAKLFGSFGGDGRTALAVVAPTLARSALFENISGAYLYALLPGAFYCYRALLSAAGPSAQITLKALCLCAAIVAFVAVASAGIAAILSSR